MFVVVNLYKNIQHTFGLEALDYWLENPPESLQARFNKKNCFKMCKIRFTKQ